MRLTQRIAGLCLGTWICLLGTAPVAWSQAVAGREPLLEEEVETFDQIDQTTPLKSMQGFMRLCELGNYELAGTYLDTRYLPEPVSAVDSSTLAQQLYVVLSRESPIDYSKLSDQLGGLENDGLPSYRDVLGTLKTQRGKLPIYLQQIPGDNDTRIWRISNASVAEIPTLYAEFGYSPLVEYVREMFPNGPPGLDHTRGGGPGRASRSARSPCGD